MQRATAIDTLEQTTRNSSKSIGSMDRAMQSLSLRASRVIWVDPMRDTTDRLLRVTMTTSTIVRQQKSQLSHLSAQLSQLSIDLATRLGPKTEPRSEVIGELYAK